MLDDVNLRSQQRALHIEMLLIIFANISRVLVGRLARGGVAYRLAYQESGSLPYANGSM